MSNPVHIGENTWRVTVFENNEDKDLYIELPYDVLLQMGWDFGAELDVVVEDDKILLTKKLDEPSSK